MFYKNYFEIIIKLEIKLKIIKKYLTRKKL